MLPKLKICVPGWLFVFLDCCLNYWYNICDIRTMRTIWLTVKFSLLARLTILGTLCPFPKSLVLIYLWHDETSAYLMGVSLLTWFYGFFFSSPITAVSTESSCYSKLTLEQGCAVFSHLVEGVFQSSVSCNPSPIYLAGYFAEAAATVKYGCSIIPSSWAWSVNLVTAWIVRLYPHVPVLRWSYCFLILFSEPISRTGRTGITLGILCVIVSDWNWALR